jgi:hypothetical protein
MRINMATVSFMLSDQADQGTGGALLWSIVLIVAILLLFGGIVLYRKWMNADDTTTGEGFTLGDLRRLHKEGKMTDGEFESAKAILIGSLKAAAAKSAAAATTRPSAGPRKQPPGFDVLPPEQ